MNIYSIVMYYIYIYNVYYTKVKTKQIVMLYIQEESKYINHKLYNLKLKENRKTNRLSTVMD